YVVKKTRYKNESITRSEQIRQCQFFLSTANDATKTAILAEIESATDEIKGYDDEVKQLRDRELSMRQQDKKLRNEKQALKDQVNHYRSLMRSIEQKEIQLRELEGNPIDLELELQKFKDEIIR
uniref:Uncharacterized protein n=1 Tax=Amphimedon queenslandica TaxID=400682 RepID=A0A1X7SHF6_AMPQE